MTSLALYPARIGPRARPQHRRIGQGILEAEILQLLSLEDIYLQYLLVHALFKLGREAHSKSL